MPASRHTDVRTGAILSAGVATLAVLFWVRRRRDPHNPAFAKQATCEDVPASTRAALEKERWLPLKHTAIRAAVDPAELNRTFRAITEAFAPQQVDYTNSAYGKVRSFLGHLQQCMPCVGKYVSRTLFLYRRD